MGAAQVCGAGTGGIQRLFVLGSHICFTSSVSGTGICGVIGLLGLIKRSGISNSALTHRPLALLLLQVDSLWQKRSLGLLLAFLVSFYSVDW